MLSTQRPWPPLNEATLDYVYRRFSGDPSLIDRRRFTTSDHTQTRIVMICETDNGFHTEGLIGGYFASISDACFQYDWERGLPVCLIDLCLRPECAVTPVSLVIRPGRLEAIADLDEYA